MLHSFSDDKPSDERPKTTNPGLIALFAVHGRGTVSYLEGD
jgi:hypothetical protein